MQASKYTRAQHIQHNHIHIRRVEYRIIIYNRTFIPTVYTAGIREGASYITRTPKPYVRFAPYIYGYKPYIYTGIFNVEMSGSTDRAHHSRVILRRCLTDNW